MNALPHLQRPSRPLPRTVKPVRDECLDSYIRRLASANRLNPEALREFVAGDKRRSAIIRVEFLAVLTGLPIRTLQYAILELCTERNLAAMSLAGRPRPGMWKAQMCSGCAATAGTKEPVMRWHVHENVLCRRHRRWTGRAAEGWMQPDLTAAPEILAANRLHHRLIRRHGRDAARRGFGAAERICNAWHERFQHDKEFLELMERLLGPGWSVDRNNPVIAAARYPQAVALARLLASPHWKGLATRDHLSTGMPDDALIAGLAADIYNETQAGHLDAHMPDHQHEEILIERYLARHPGTRVFTEEIRRVAVADYRFSPFAHHKSYTPITKWVRDELSDLRRSPEHRIRWAPETF